MIELRWIEVIVQLHGSIATEKRLQYRTGNYGTYIGKPEEYPNINLIWSEWIDVPTVSP